MRFKSLLPLILVCQIVLSAPSALANTLKYTAPTADQAGQFEGELPLKSIANLKLPNGAVVMKGDQVQVMAVPDWLFDRNVVLAGPVVRAEFASQANDSVIGGLVYFSQGEWLTNLASPRAVDVIETLSGEVIRGRILSNLGGAFAVKPQDGATRKVEFATIKTIDSPRAFRFSIPTSNAKISPTDNSLDVDAQRISFSPTMLRGGIMAMKPAVPRSTLPGADPGISKGTLATFLALDMISEVAPAIAIPLALQPATQKAALRTISQYSTASQRAQGIPIPLSNNSQGDSRYLGPFGAAINPFKP